MPLALITVVDSLFSMLWSFAFYPIVDVLRFLLWCLALLKWCLMFRSLLWLSKSGSAYKNSVNLILSKNCSDNISKIDNISIPRHFLLPQRCPNIFIKMERLLFRQPVLCILLGTDLMILPHYSSPFVYNARIILILFLLFFAFLNMLLGRIVLGYIDNFRSDFHLVNNANNIDRDSLIAKFMYGLVLYVISVIVSFSGLFTFVQIISEGKAFDGVLSDGTPLYFQMIYLSVVTLATVGYGDIKPAQGMAQAFTGLEVLLGLGLFGILFFVLANTLSRENLRGEP